MKTFLKSPEKKEVYMAQRTKSKQMKIKQPSLKGMKNTKYLGHFAQDKYIQKGHNLSGVFPTADIEKFSVSNPFEANLEMQRRQKEVSDELARMEAERVKTFQQFSAREPSLYERFGDSPEAQSAQMQAAQIGRIRTAEDLRARQEMESYRGRRKKFLEEL